MNMIYSLDFYGQTIRIYAFGGFVPTKGKSEDSVELVFTTGLGDPYIFSIGELPRAASLWIAQKSAKSQIIRHDGQILSPGARCGLECRLYFVQDALLNPVLYVDREPPGYK